MNIKEFVKVIKQNGLIKRYHIATSVEHDGYCTVVCFKNTEVIKISSSDSKNFAANAYNISASSTSIIILEQIIKLLKKGGYGK